MSTNDDETNELQTQTRIFNVMGVGTFLLGFFVVAIAVVWFFSYSCAAEIKVAWRASSIALFLFTAGILLYAPRTNREENNSFEEDQYDYSIIPRVAISLVMMIFGIVSCGMLGSMAAEKRIVRCYIYSLPFPPSLWCVFLSYF